MGRDNLFVGVSSKIIYLLELVLLLHVFRFAYLHFYMFILSMINLRLHLIYFIYLQIVIPELK